MCIYNLKTREQYPAPPDGTIRWKLMALNSDGTVRGTNHLANGDSSYEEAGERQKVGDVRRSNADLRDHLLVFNYPYYQHADSMAHTRGIHVCAVESDVDLLCNSYVYGGGERKGYAKVKVECRGFLHAGEPDFTLRDAWGVPLYGHVCINETWREVTILEITPYK